MEDLLHVDPLELEIGFRLIGLADPTRGGDLLDRLKRFASGWRGRTGLIVPQVRIHDEIGLAPNEYRVKIRGNMVGQGTAYSGRLLAVPPGGMVTPAGWSRRHRPASPDSRQSGFMPTAAKWPSWRVAACLMRRRWSPAISVRSSPTTRTSS